MATVVEFENDFYVLYGGAQSASTLPAAQQSLRPLQTIRLIQGPNAGGRGRHDHVGRGSQ